MSVVQRTCLVHSLMLHNMPYKLAEAFCMIDSMCCSEMRMHKKMSLMLAAVKHLIAAGP